MLTQFTWQQFLVAISVLTLVWYGSVILLYYRIEVKKLLSGDAPDEDKPTPLPHRWEKQVDQLQQDEDQNLMGKSKLPEGVSVVDMDELQFADPDVKVKRLGLIPDVLEDIKTVFDILGKEDGTKQDFFLLMETIRNNYPGLNVHPNLPQINNFIIANAPFHLSGEELENLWS